MSDRSETIRCLNDRFRQGFQDGRVVATEGIAALPEATRNAVLRRVREFTAFSKGNDPHGEHDFGNFEEEGHRMYWKIDYYDLAMEFGSEDPADPTKTTRVLTIMLASEY